MREANIPMRVTYDRKQGYIYIAGPDDGQASAHQVRLDPPTYNGPGQIILDFDERWRLVGIDLGDANRSLPQSVLRRVKRA